MVGQCDWSSRTALAFNCFPHSFSTEAPLGRGACRDCLYHALRGNIAETVNAREKDCFEHRGAERINQDERSKGCYALFRHAAYVSGCLGL
jgi:hypothetical protein